MPRNVFLVANHGGPNVRNHTMTTTTATPAKVAVYVAPKGDELTAAVAALRTRYVAADKGEKTARDLFDAADIAWQNARVVKVRVAYAAAMLTPNKGASNLLAATRFLLTDPADTPAKRSTQAKSRKNTMRPYVDAGDALQAAGLATRIAEPDAEERKIVAEVFRAANKRDKAEAKGQAPESDGTGTTTTAEAPEDVEALTYTTLVVHLAKLNADLKIMRAGGVLITEAEAANFGEMLAELGAQVTAYAEGK